MHKKIILICIMAVLIAGCNLSGQKSVKVYEIGQLDKCSNEDELVYDIKVKQEDGTLADLEDFKKKQIKELRDFIKSLNEYEEIKNAEIVDIGKTAHVYMGNGYTKNGFIVYYDGEIKTEIFKLDYMKYLNEWYHDDFKELEGKKVDILRVKKPVKMPEKYKWIINTEVIGGIVGIELKDRNTQGDY